MDTIEARVTLVNLMCFDDDSSEAHEEKPPLPAPKKMKQEYKTTGAKKTKKRKETKQNKTNKTEQYKTKPKRSIIDNVITTVKEGEQSSSQWAKHGLLEARYSCIRC